MGKAAERGAIRVAANVQRHNTGWIADVTATVLDHLAGNFSHMLRADDIDGLDDVEVRHIEKARAEVQQASRRLRAIEKRCKHDR